MTSISKLIALSAPNLDTYLCRTPNHTGPEANVRLERHLNGFNCMLRITYLHLNTGTEFIMHDAEFTAKDRAEWQMLGEQLWDREHQWRSQTRKDALHILQQAGLFA